MKKALIWGMGAYFHQVVHIVKDFENNHEIEIYGLTSNTTIYRTLYGYSFIDKKDIDICSIDVVIVAVSEKNYTSILKEAVSIGFENYQVMPYWTLCLPDFDMDKYLRLRKNPPSIFAINCWGGLTCHSLGLEFMSPCVNLRFNESDYLKFVSNRDYYLDKDLDFEKGHYDSDDHNEYPIAYCDDIRIEFLHYKTPAEAEEKWNLRKKRINENNVFIMMYTENMEIADKFKVLKEKKICFVPFEIDDGSFCRIPFRYMNELGNISLYEIVNRIARNIYPFYDVIELLLSGTIKENEVYRQGIDLK